MLPFCYGLIFFQIFLLFFYYHLLQNGYNIIVKLCDKCFFCNNLGDSYRIRNIFVERLIFFRRL
ncbi:MAG: hypothetical protein AMJ79_03880 [Phycisphaerae bacterium SM23_30]|nr:MAG: hypothetical protein AMJ79_03880 [Phycisphaerae bacterium SM23_30]